MPTDTYFYLKNWESDYIFGGSHQVPTKTILKTKSPKFWKNQKSFF